MSNSKKQLAVLQAIAQQEVTSAMKTIIERIRGQGIEIYGPVEIGLLVRVLLEEATAMVSASACASAAVTYTADHVRHARGVAAKLQEEMAREVVTGILGADKAAEISPGSSSENESGTVH